MKTKVQLLGLSLLSLSLFGGVVLAETPTATTPTEEAKPAPVTVTPTVPTSATPAAATPIVAATSKTETVKPDNAASSQEVIFAGLKESLKALVPGKEPDLIKETPLPGVYQVNYGVEVYYMGKDARYVLDGSLLDLKLQRNLTEETVGSARKALLDKIDPKSMISFPAKEEKHVLTVFTDIDCPYCVKLHQEVPELNENGVTVRYLLFPRAGVGSNSFKKAVHVWCNKNQQDALTDAKNRKKVEAQECENPIAAQYEQGAEMGVTGTPAMVTQSGALLPGYRPAKFLVAMLAADAAQAQSSAKAEKQAPEAEALTPVAPTAPVAAVKTHEKAQ